MQSLPAQHFKDKYFLDIEDQLKKIFYEILFKPIGVILLDKTEDNIILENSSEFDYLKKTILDGTIQYKDGYFYGYFNSKISKALKNLGAKFNLTTKSFYIEPTKTPYWVITYANQYQYKAKEANEQIKKSLSDIQENLEYAVNDYLVKPQHSLNLIEQDFIDINKSIRLSVPLTEKSKQVMIDEYTNNMKLYIKTFSEDMIQELRMKTEQNAMSGYRFEKLIEDIQDRYNVTMNKAKFLARQETSLFMSEYRKNRFIDNGVRKYKWSAVGDSRTRPYHKELNGKVFQYDSPPIIDDKTGKRGNPGQDFGCRCVDIPLLGYI